MLPASTNPPPPAEPARHFAAACDEEEFFWVLERRVKGRPGANRCLCRRCGWEGVCDLAPLAKRFCSTFVGQGASERSNKDIAGERTKDQFSQLPIITSARMELLYASRWKNRREAPVPKPFLECLKLRRLAIRAAVAEEAEVEAEARAILRPEDQPLDISEYLDDEETTSNLARGRGGASL